MRKRVSQDWTIYKKFATKRWGRSMPKLPFSASVRLSSPKVPAMKKPSGSPAHYSSHHLLTPSYSDTPMHQEESAYLGQQINQLILSGATLETVLQQMAQLLGEAFQVDCCLVTIASFGQFEQTQIGNWYAPTATVMPLPQPPQLVEHLAKMMPTATNSKAFDDVNADSTTVKEWQHLLPGIEAILQIPAFCQGKLNGVVSLIRFQPHQWSESETKRATAIASSVAIAFSHLAQTKTISSLQQQVSRSAQSKNLLNSLTTASRSSMELNSFLQQAIAGMAQTLEATRGFIILLKYVDPLFKTRAREKIPKAKATVVCEWSQNDDSGVSTSHQTNTILNQSFWISECIFCQLGFSKFPNAIVVTDEHDLPPIDPASDAARFFNFSQLPSLLMLPLESQGTVLGFLVLQHSQVRQWQPEELSLVELVSAQLSTTIIQNQTLRQVQSLVDERTTQLQRSLEVQSKLYEKTRQQIDQLRHLNSLKDEFLSTMSHELRTPLTSMSLAIRMLRQPGINPERQAKYLDILEQQCTQEINLINDLLKLQQLESNQTPLKLETIDIKPKLQDLAQSFTQTWTDKGIAIDLDLPTTSLLFQTDMESFERILQELLTNAGKYSNPDTTVVLKVAHQAEPEVDRIVLTLTNIGSGISPEDIDHIFDKFRRGQGITQQAIQGTGLGLALVKCLVQQLNGNIHASSDRLKDSSAYETCFTLTLPQSFSP